MGCGFFEGRAPYPYVRMKEAMRAKVWEPDRQMRTARRRKKERRILT